jgi:hypothetical protein
MEWDYDFYIRIGPVALLRRKDKYMKAESKRWAIGWKAKDGYWTSKSI